MIYEEQLRAIAGEVLGILRPEEWCNVELTTADPQSLRLNSVPSRPLYLLVNKEADYLTNVIRTLRAASVDSIFFFVNFFHYPYPCLDLLRAGFDDFLSYPFDPPEMRSSMCCALKRREASLNKERVCTKKNLTMEIALRDLIGIDNKFRKVLNEIRILAGADATVLISGETGTGKDLCARAIHYTGNRWSKPFLPLNCGGVPDELFENELFGHEKGAYTDAHERNAGLIHEAEGGTIFLDDVESLSSKNQSKLLRFLQGNEYLALGSSKVRRANVRVIAATNLDLRAEVQDDTFREDLFFRLAVLTLNVPALRDRADDIVPLAEYFLVRYCEKYERPTPVMSSCLIRKMKSYSWPGNVRELESAIHMAVIHSTSHILEAVDVHFENQLQASAHASGGCTIKFNQLKKDVITNLERSYVEELLRECGGNISEAARRAGKDRRSFWEIMRRNNLTNSNN